MGRALAGVLAAGLLVSPNLLWASPEGEEPFERSPPDWRLVSAAVTLRNAEYEYAYEIRFPPDEPLAVFRVPSAEGRLHPVPPPDPALFPEGWPDHGPEGYVRWPLWEQSFSDVASVRLTARSPLPPSLGEALLESWAEEAVEREAARQWKAGGTVCNEGLREIRRSALRAVLVPVPREGPLGTFGHARSLLEELSAAVAAGWIPEEASKRWAACAERALEAGLRGDWEEWERSWRQWADRAEEARGEGVRSELCDWASLNAAVLLPSRPEPCEPSFSISASGEVLPVDRRHTVTIRLWDAAGGAPLPNGGVEIEYLDGERAGRREAIPSSPGGWWTLHFSADGPGEKRLRIRPLPPERETSCFPGKEERTLRLRWWGGADLRCELFPDRARLSPGEVLEVTESTWNAGSRRASGSRTAYLVRRYSGPQDGPWRLVGLRATPPLWPGEESRLSPARLRLPPDLEPGWYDLAAVADWQGTLLETSETNNSSSLLFPTSAGPQEQATRVAGTPSWVDVSEDARPRPRPGVPRMAPSPFEGSPVDPPCQEPSAWNSLFHPEPHRIGDHAPEDLAPGLWKEAIGRVNLRLTLPRGTAHAVATVEDLASVEGLRVPVHQKTAEGFRPRSRRVATLVPLDVERDPDPPPASKAREVTLVFPAYAEEAGWVQVALDVRTGERGWLRLGPSAALFRLDLDTPSDLDRRAGSADLVSLLREPYLRAYAGPSLRSPWTVLDPLGPPPEGGIPWSLTLRRIRNGFALVEARTCLAGDERSVPVGWVRLRDDRGNLLVWPTPGVSGCC